MDSILFRSEDAYTGTGRNSNTVPEKTFTGQAVDVEVLREQNRPRYGKLHSSC